MRKSVIGEVYGNLTILRLHAIDKRHVKYVCLCVCGKETIARIDVLRASKKICCGCTTGRHRVSHTGAYKSWKAMMERCYSVTHMHYDKYGGRGIKVCRRWHDVRNFIADMGERPEGLSLERKNTNKNYTPKNCSWETAKVQANNRRNNVLIKFEGEKLTSSQWADRFGIPRRLFSKRYRDLGWTLDKIRELGNKDGRLK